MGVIPFPVPSPALTGSTGSYVPVSEIFTVTINDPCTRSANEHLQLMWLNRYGHYDYYTFSANRYQGVGIERTTYNTWNLDWGSSDPNKTPYSRGLTDSEVRMTETVVVNSGFISNDMFLFLEELYTSNQVYEIQTDGSITPVNIVSTEFEKKIQGNKTIYNLELTYVYSNNIKLLGI